MKKFLSLFLIFCFAFVFSQNYTVAQVEKTTDPKVIAAFLKENPDHPKSGEFKSKLVMLITKDNDPIAKPKVKPLKKGKLARDYSREYNRDTRYGSNTNTNTNNSNGSNKQTAQMLTNLFSTDPNKKEAIVQIKNNSDCNLIVKFSGKDFYNLSIPAKNQSYVMVNKGNYILTTSICDAKYSSAKKIFGDIVISLSSQ